MTFKLHKKKLLLVGLIIFLMIGLSGCTVENSVDVNNNDDSSNEQEQNSSTIETEEVNHDQKLSGTLEVHFIDVGQGAAQLIIGPSGKTIVIDGGNNDDENRMVQYLKDHGVKQVDILIGTHPDADHIGGIDAVIDNFDIGKIYMPKVQANTKTFESVLLSIKNKGYKVTTAKAGITLDWEDTVQAEMIAPVKESYEDRNDMSAVVHLTFGDTSFLLTGDAEHISENDMMESGVNLKSDVMLVGHHGSSSSTSQAFLDHVQPRYAVIQVGKNSYGHPTDEVLKRISENGIKIYRNDTDGTIIFTSDGKTLTVNKSPWEYTPVEKVTNKDPKTTDQKNDAEATNQNSNTSTSNDKVSEISATATIDNPTPSQNSTLTVTVKVKDGNGTPISGAKVTLTLHYKSKDTIYEGTTNSNGISNISFKIGRAAKGFTVVGDIFVSYDEKTTTTTTTTETQFIPQ